mmetsp:Transcript_31679/g.68391  ORF Transcript_31679/g.68391 Transcript_31679/m.68391 type:complete len:520 (-) Transcript_31679:256-1815(-)
MTADLRQVVITAQIGAKSISSPTQLLPTSPHHKPELPNPQQGMADPGAATSVGANTTDANTTSNTACTSPLTVTSLEAGASAAVTPAVTPTAASGVPQVVSQVVPAAQLQPLLPPPQSTQPPVTNSVAVPPTMESMLGKLNLNHPPQPPSHPVVAAAHRLPTQMEEKKLRLRTPPTEHDNRKLFVGGLPTDVTDQDFLEFFQQFGDVIDSVVIIDRLTKRSRGFGFVTFATENFANSLLTAIPGKTGYVVINGKQCEVKASTPKADDAPHYKHGHHHGHGAPGLWRSNPPRHDHHRGGYGPRHPINHAPRGPGQMKQQTMHDRQHQPRGEKNFSIDNEFNGDVDGRHFDEMYAQSPPPQMNASYQPMYGRGVPTTNPYHQNYQNAYASAAPNAAYSYPNSSGASAASVPSSWEASYPASAQTQGYVQYASNAMQGNNGYYDPYAVQQYPNHYDYGNNSNSMQPPMMMGQQQTGYANYNSYNTEGVVSVPSQGSGDGYESYPQAYPNSGEYDHAETADQY